MKVTQNSTPIQLDAYVKQIQKENTRQAGTAQSNTVQSGKTDTVQLSAQARQVQQTALVQGVSADIREEKVRQVKMEIESGTYKVDANQVASDMLQETFENNGILNQIDTWA